MTYEEALKQQQMKRHEAYFNHRRDLVRQLMWTPVWGVPDMPENTRVYTRPGNFHEGYTIQTIAMFSNGNEFGDLLQAQSAYIPQSAMPTMEAENDNQTGLPNLGL